MLAYVFWQWPRSEVTAADYEKSLALFFHGLKTHKPRGFIDCFGLRLSSFPWNAPGSRGYEDWYLLEDFESLGVLNDAAVSREMKATHDTVALLAGGGAGGIYKRYGNHSSNKIQFSSWFTKPVGMSYQDLRSELAQVIPEGYWQRQMTLGPAPEFCLHGHESRLLPQKLKSVTVDVKQL